MEFFRFLFFFPSGLVYYEGSSLPSFRSGHGETGDIHRHCACSRSTTRHTSHIGLRKSIGTIVYPSADLCTGARAGGRCSSAGTRLFLRLVIHELNVVFGYVFVLLEQELLDLVAHVALDHDLLAATGCFRDGGPRSKLLAKLLGYLSRNRFVSK